MPKFTLQAISKISRSTASWSTTRLHLYVTSEAKHRHVSLIRCCCWMMQVGVAQCFLHVNSVHCRKHLLESHPFYGRIRQWSAWLWNGHTVLETQNRHHRVNCQAHTSAAFLSPAVRSHTLHLIFIYTWSAAVCAMFNRMQLTVFMRDTFKSY